MAKFTGVVLTHSCYLSHMTLCSVSIRGVHSRQIKTIILLQASTTEISCCFLQQNTNDLPAH